MPEKPTYRIDLCLWHVEYSAVYRAIERPEVGPEYKLPGDVGYSKEVNVVAGQSIEDAIAVVREHESRVWEDDEAGCLRNLLSIRFTRVKMLHAVELIGAEAAKPR